VDANADGRTDIVAGVLDGIQVWPQLETGEFGYPYLLIDTSYLNFETYQVEDPFRNLGDGGIAGSVRPWLADWNRDGILDVLFGDTVGHVYFYPGEGVRDGQLRFGTPERLTVDGEEICAEHGMSSPCVHDWDGDGRDDLLLGSHVGSVLFFRNTSADGVPVLAEPVVLVPSAGAHRIDPRHFEPGLERGRNIWVSVVDYNGDGLSDLLLGAHHVTEAEERELTLVDQARLDLAWDHYGRIDLEFWERLRQLLHRVLRRLKLPREDWGEDRVMAHHASEELMLAVRGDRKMQAILERLREAALPLREFRSYDTWYGRVWVYLRRPGS